jgi:O-antigen/teichoic acid export membrane protein
VTTTEGTANAHAYLVTLFGGGAAFAPLAATALLVRPISLVANALTELERPRLARLLAGRPADGAVRGTIRLFRGALLGTWLGSLLLAVAVLLWAPHWLFPPEYSIGTLWTGVLLWLSVALIQVIRTPEGVTLQAAGRFRILAMASVVSCGFSLALVGVLVAQQAYVWSLLGVVAGEIVIAVIVWTTVTRAGLGRSA